MLFGIVIVLLTAIGVLGEIVRVSAIQTRANQISLMIAISGDIVHYSRTIHVIELDTFSCYAIHAVPVAG